MTQIASIYLISVAVHVAAAILAFGPTFVFPLIQKTAEKDPRSLPYALGLIDKISRGIVYPVGAIVLITGFFQIAEGNWQFGENHWLDTSIALFILLYALAILVGDRAIRRGRDVAARLVEEAGPTGEVVLTDEYRAAIRASDRLGPLLGLIVLVIVYLMVAKPF